MKTKHAGFIEIITLLIGAFSLIAGYMSYGFTRKVEVLPIEFTPVDYSQIQNFEECYKAGFPTTKSYPGTCTLPDGRKFVQEIKL